MSIKSNGVEYSSQLKICLAIAVTIAALLMKSGPVLAFQGSVGAPAASGASSPVTAAEFKPFQIRQLLRNQGYWNIQFTDRRLPRYVAQACRDGGRFELTMNRFGEIRRSRQIGQCANRNNDAGQRARRDDDDDGQAIVDADELRDILRSRGFNRIRVTDGNLPRYEAEACKNDTRYRVYMNRFGEVSRLREIGQCREQQADRGITRNDLTEALNARGYFDIRVVDDRLPIYVVEACRNGRQFRVRTNRFGEIKGRKRLGWCQKSTGAIIRVAPTRIITNSELDSRSQVDPNDCQDYFDYLLSRDTVYFDTASARIRSESLPLLRRLARLSNRCPGAHIEVAGHTDSDGRADYNQRLSEERAFSVASFLSEIGVRRSRLSPVGYGEERPVAANNSERNKQLNRRIEFIVEWDEG